MVQKRDFGDKVGEPTVYEVKMGNSRLTEAEKQRRRVLGRNRYRVLGIRLVSALFAVVEKIVVLLDKLGGMSCCLWQPAQPDWSSNQTQTTNTTNRWKLLCIAPTQQNKQKNIQGMRFFCTLAS